MQLDHRIERFTRLRDLCRERFPDYMPPRHEMEAAAEVAGVGIISKPEAWFIDFMVDVSPETLATGFRHESQSHATFVLIQTLENSGRPNDYSWTLWTPVD